MNPISERNVTDNLDQLLDILPANIRQAVLDQNDTEDLIEIVLDLGREPEVRYPKRVELLSDRVVTHEDIAFVVQRVGSFGGDNRAGIERTLHRISAIRNRRGDIVGLTLRVGRAVQGTIDIVRELVESGRSILMMGRPGVGKCVAGDTWVLTAQGMRQMRDFAPSEVSNETFYPLQIELAALNGRESTSQFYYDGVRQTRRLKTRMGYQLEGTFNHPVLVLDELGNLTFKKLEDLGAGEYVAIQRGQNLFGAETQLPTFVFESRTSAKDNGLTPATLTPQLARYLGYIVAEGTTTYRYMTGFSGQDPDVQADMGRLTHELFDLPLVQQPSSKGWNGKDFRIMGRKHRAYLAHLGIDYVRAAEKRIPDCILQAPKVIIAAFLRGYFEGEASIGKQYGVEVSSASVSLMQQLHVLLLNFGIVAKLRSRLNKRYQRHYYYLNIKGEGVQLFADSIGFVSTVKRNRLSELLEMSRNPNLDVIPNQSDKLQALRAQIAMSQPKSHALVGARGEEIPSLVSGYRAAHPILSKYTRLERDPSYDTLGRILDETQALAESPIRQSLQALHEMNFYYDEVVSFETGEAAVYDFTVPFSHSFFGNGLVNHNTTKLREMARVLADDLGKRVIVIDTSNEIAGDGDIPHPAIGRSRRMQVAAPEKQHAVMIEAVENHMPQVIIIDEISTEAEALAARTIAERGVQLIGTAHGNSIENIIMNPSLNDLVGGIGSVTLSDEEARRRGTQKTVLERKSPPTFDIAIEIQDRYRLAIHQDVAEVVDQYLRGSIPAPEIRSIDDSGNIRVFQEPAADLSRSTEHLTGEKTQIMRIFPYAVSRSQLERVIKGLRLQAVVTKNLEDADIVMVLRSYAKGNAKIMEWAEDRQIQVQVVKSNTIHQIQKAIREALDLDASMNDEEEEEAMQEVKTAIELVARRNQPQDLMPREASIRRLQHELVEEYHLRSESVGTEPNRRLRIYPR